MIIDCAVWRDGRGPPRYLAFDELTHQRPQSPHRDFVWVALRDPTVEELDAVGREFSLAPQALVAASRRHERPELEVHDGTVLLIIRTVTNDDVEGRVEMGEVALLLGSDFLVSARRGPPATLEDVRSRLTRPHDEDTNPQHDQALVASPLNAFRAVMSHVDKDFIGVFEHVDGEIHDLEAAVFSETRHQPTERIYGLKRLVLDARRATAPFDDPLNQLSHHHLDFVDAAFQSYVRETNRRRLRANELLSDYLQVLDGMLDASLTQVSLKQNEDMRRISAWAAIVAVPTLIAGVYGMNFDHMPELRWMFGYPIAMVAMIVIGFLVYRFFKRSGWL
jgi:magnesium transporter